ncbi:TonB-dependent siderophore receptor [Dyella sp.]|jgi:outer membrane receptor for ferric coprogen and ferric-rhodotorulic acid|uniref:TonB-dependent siderophore receptor n=1 Tax=Dyella sp. TaxID=1869338 RepID=UPI002D779F49|nr:TonB-dependent siderophore receptor [Dyella sp.]HET6433674.1 TonB-dependent siderophore receptor [Dyella sp.]
MSMSDPFAAHLSGPSRLPASSRRRAVTLAVVLCLSLSTSAAMAADRTPATGDGAVRVQGFRLQADSLRGALDAFARQSRVQLDGLDRVPADLSSSGLRGEFRTAEALYRLLAGTGWQAVRLGAAHYRLVPGGARVADAKELPGVLTTATIDSLSTEGTGSYTTAAQTSATRLPLSIRETPQSVSVITRAQMDDFGLDSANDVLARTTGINVEKIETDRTYYSARGFDITNFLVDGLGLPFTSGGQQGDIDTAVYDHIEVLRGANGLLSFTGNPSATVNFVRKRPTAELQGNVGVTVGSWNHRRVDLDLSGAMNRSASVRGRFVAVDQDSDSYLDRYTTHKHVLSGIAEADLADDTMLTAGITWQRDKSKDPMWGALALYNTDGSPTHYDRATNPAADWSYWNIDDTRSFVQLDQGLGNDWHLKAALNHRRLSNASELFYIYGTPDAGTGLGLFSYPSRYTGVERQDYADLFASGPFSLGGRTHQLVIGANWARDTNQERSDYSADIGTPLPDIDRWTGNYPRPAFDAYSDGSHFRTRRQSAYVTARWSLGEPLTLITGDSITRIHSDGLSYGVAHAYQQTRSTPYAGLVYDLGAHYSAYASYAAIFNPQTETDAGHRVLDPITGSNVEAGIKGAWFDQRLNATAAVFRTRQNNFAEYAGFHADTGQSYYRGTDAIAKGWELDVAGSLTRNWELSAGYTQLQIDTPEGADARTYVPRRTLRVSSSVRVAAVDGLKVGGSLRWQSAISRDQAALDPAGNEIYTRQGSYALVGLMARYDFNQAWSATLNLDNVTGRKYINSLYWAQGYYGAPASAMLRVDWRF